jgi:hypothetical protein
VATRPVFMSETSGALVRVMEVEFLWHPGMARSQKQKSVRSLHQALIDTVPATRVLEVSSASETRVGQQLSAFNLTFNTRGRGREIAVECAFQGSKVFESGGPYTDLMDASPLDAKRDPRLQDSGRLVGFRFFEQDWPLEPQTAFYDWIYINALHQNSALADEVMAYDAFTDIAFNPQKSINCQAGAAALFVSLRRRGLLERALSSHADYMSIVAGSSGRSRADDEIQGQLF